MNTNFKDHLLIPALVAVIISTSNSSHADNEPKISQAEKANAKLMIWEDRDPHGLNLSYAAGTADDAGRPVGPLKWKGESDYQGSASPKFSVVDKTGRKFRVKVQKTKGSFLKPNNDEVHSENVAFRLLFNLGYHSEETYFVPKSEQLEVEGLSDSEYAKLKKVKSSLTKKSDGKYYLTADASFRFKDPSVLDNSESWSYGDPSVSFFGSKYLSGLLILDVMINNFDTHPGNTNIQYVRKSDGSIEAWYAQDDAGASFGKDEGISLLGHLMPGMAQSKWVLGDYEESKFIRAVSDGMVHFHYMDNQPVLSRREAHRHVPLKDAQWFTGVLNRLSNEQIHGIFRSSTDDIGNADAFAEIFIRKRNELRDATQVYDQLPVGAQ